MKTTKWIWFLSGDLKSWDLLSLSLTAKNLVQNGERLTILSEAGIYPGTYGNIISWNSLGFLDKFLWLSCRGRLWHLWGEAPSWWSLIKARSITVHSLKGNTDWQGHPVFISASNELVDRNALVPAFEKDLVWGHPGEANREPVVVALCPAMTTRPDRNISEILLQDDLNMPIFKTASHSGLIPGKGAVIQEEDILPVICKRGGVLVLTGVDQSLAVLSGFAAMYGVPTIAPWTPLLDKILGPEGYIAIPGVACQKGIISNATGDYGKKVATFARHRLEELFSPDLSGENIRNIYKNLGGKTF